jgi:hypothetical protein
MANNVFANGREISCKKADGKTVCAFPDICMTPPTSPATPAGVPIPYPNTGMAKDTTNGSRTVNISSQEVILKNVSYYKTSYGDEAGCATPAKKGIITGTIQGKVYFTVWSMDVKVESKNVTRHMDLTTHNHASQIGNESIPWLHADTMAFDLSEECKAEQTKFKNACNNCIKRHPDNTINASGTSEAMCQNKDCKDARKCTLLPYSIECCKDDYGDKQTPHHLIPNSLLQSERNDSSTNVDGLKESYTTSQGPCCCVTGKTQTQKDHGKIHDDTKEGLRSLLEKEEEVTYEKTKKIASKAHTDAIKNKDGSAACKQECLEAQLDIFFNSKSETKNANDIKFRQQDGATVWKPKKDGIAK